MLVNCKYCGLEFEKQNSQIRKSPNHFCSRSCAAKVNNVLYQKKKSVTRINCLCCNNQTGRKKYCSKACFYKHLKIYYIEQWLDNKDPGYTKNGIIKPYIRRYLLAQANYECSKCSWNKKHQDGTSTLHVHHIDGNYKNCRPKNLQVLCPNCHSLTDNYGARNKHKNKLRHKNRKSNMRN